jgi:cell division protein FtsI/penicillin-binding protein 2
MLKHRIALFYTLLFLGLLIFIGKLFFVQIVDGEHFRRAAHNQYVAPASDVFDRGTIFFKSKDETLLSAAAMKDGFVVAILPKEIQNANLALNKLSSVIQDVDRETFFAKVAKKEDPYEEIARRVSKRKADEIRALGIKGVNVYREQWRFYPNETLASHVLGFVGFQGENFGGRYGIERYYNNTLVREEKGPAVNFFARAFDSVSSPLFEKTRKEGDVILEIEAEVERFLEQSLDAIMEEWQTTNAGALIMNPSDGAMYAMTARPNFNPNTFNASEDYDSFPNPMVENVYEMGSIVKPITVAAGIDAGVITPDSTYVDKGVVGVENILIGNYDGKGRGEVSMQEVLNQSLNTGAVHVMQELGKENFANYFSKFGFGEETGIDLPGEISGLVENLKSPREIEYATASFGQGIAVTPIAMARALAALANGGMLVTPHVADQITYSLGRPKIVSFGGEKRVISEDTSEAITRMLVRVVDEALKNGEVKLPRYSVAAKTGTAQIAREDGRGYKDGKFLHSFFGYFPAYEPKFLIFLYVVEPVGARYASETLTDPFIDIVEFLISYYDIPPDR